MGTGHPLTQGTRGTVVARICSLLGEWNQGERLHVEMMTNFDVALLAIRLLPLINISALADRYMNLIQCLTIALPSAPPPAAGRSAGLGRPIGRLPATR